MDILLSHGYFIAEDEHEQKIMKPYPTLGLLYISSYLKAKDFAVEVFDSTFATLADFEIHLRRTRPSLVGLYCNLMTKQNVLRMIALSKEVGARVVVGGPEPPHYALEYLDSGADVVVVGEGEATLEELIPHLAKHGPHRLDSIFGIVFRNEEGQVIRTPPRPQLADLSAQPWPDREAIDLDRYLETWKTHHGASSVSLITARGCPYTCTWCSHSVFGETHRRRSPQDVAEEVAWLAERYQPDQLWYADDVFTIHPRWFLQYADELKKRRLKIPFECISRADRLNDRVVDALAEMGCDRLWIGAESGSQRVLDRMQRKANIEDVQAKTRLLQTKGVSVGMFIMLGYEGEDVSDLEATVDHLKKSNPDIFLTTVAYPIKGTKYYQAVESQVVSHLDWTARTDRDFKVNGRYSRRFYDYATRWMVNEVNLHKLRRSGSKDFGRMAKMFINAQRGRLGMRLTQHEREGGSGQPGSGRGWSAPERAAEGW
ncbi:MAG: Mg-protoporphyrin IX monomethyl ester oxidative cyclase [Chloroflexota bacterium]|nr:MAG: Mg-protoporphyrin IX monomethyl ester oxidative cyclase [Chloroflexota bacterium]